MRPLKYALRTLFRSPFVTAVAVVSLALGIGANAAIFSLFDQMLLKPLPVAAPHELVNLSAPGPKPGSTSCNQAGNCSVVLSYPMYRDLEREQRVFTGMAAHRAFGANVAFQGQTTFEQGMLVSGSYFGVLGLGPVTGRLIGPQDDQAVGQGTVVVLSHEYWRRRFNEDPAVVNESMVVNGQAMTVIGVAPEGFTGTTLGSRPSVFVPITMRGVMQPGFVRQDYSGFEDRRSYWVYAFARLAPGTSIDQAATGINGPYRNLLNETEAPLQTGMSDQTMAQFRAKQVVLEEGLRGQSNLHANARTPLLLLLTVTGVVVLIACANIANLLLARAAGRAGEMAVRLSIGASRRQLVGQLLTESCLLAVLGGLAGVLVARGTLNGIRAILPPQAAETVSGDLSGTALLFVAALALGTGLLFGLFPAIHATRPDLVSTLKGTAGQPSGARSASRFRMTLATVQIALSMALLMSAGLFTKSLMNVSRVELGIDVERMFTFGIAPELNGYTPEQSRQLFQSVEEAVGTLPGVSSVAAAMVGALAGNSWGSDVRVEGFDAGPDTDTNSRYNEVGPGYFRTMGMTMLAGREFTDADVLESPRVAVVNEAFLTKFNLGRDAVGKRMSSGSSSELDTEIVGIVQNAKYSEVKQEVPPLFFRPYRQNERLGFLNFYVRTSLAPESLLSAVQPTMARLDPSLPVLQPRTMTQQVRDNVFMDRLITTLSAAFAILATLLAAIGLYGVLAYTVAQRTREIGLRMALGADAGRVRAMLLRQVGVMTVIGGLIGLATAVGIGTAARSQLFEIEGHDPAVMAVSAVLLVVVALTAGLIPALRASRIDPMRALRYE
jgi:predicted permease